MERRREMIFDRPTLCDNVTGRCAFSSYKTLCSSDICSSDICSSIVCSADTCRAVICGTGII